MKVRDLSGRVHIWNLTKSAHGAHINASQLHTKAVEFLRSIYPATIILEEVSIPGENLYIDIYLPVLNTAVECQGSQHFEHTPFFHGRDPANFKRAQARDKDKKDWCRLNGIRIVYFYEGETEEEWKKKF